MATLSQLRMDFTSLVSKLIAHAESLGYRMSLGEGTRTDEQAVINSLGQQGREAVAKLIYKDFPRLSAALVNNGRNDGVVNSVHLVGLAVDMNLFKDGVFLTSSEDHRVLGEWWKAQHPLARWGGDFRPKPDGNHYSFEYNGVK